MTTSPDLDPTLPEFFTLDQALVAGLTAEQVRYRLESGRWEHVGRGAYRRTDWADEENDHFERRRRDHVHRAIAAAKRNRGTIIGYESAATVQAMPLWNPVPDHVTLLVSRTQFNGRRNRLVLRQLEIPPADVIVVDGVSITSPARTWLDVARTRDLADALAAGDAGLRAGLFTRDDLQSALIRAEGTRGCRHAALALKHVDGVRESPGESGSWAYFVDHRLELPECQVELRDSSGRLVARVDFRWKGARVVGEFDGRLKYEAADDVYAEKRREDEIRALGERVVRWGAADLRSSDLAQRLRALTDPA